jgi:hypothetical protein
VFNLSWPFRVITKNKAANREFADLGTRGLLQKKHDGTWSLHAGNCGSNDRIPELSCGCLTYPCQPAEKEEPDSRSGRSPTPEGARMSKLVVIPDEKAGIYINPSGFEPLNELRRTGILLHEMCHFYLQMVEDRDPREFSAHQNITGTVASYDWTSFQINFGRLFREDVK